MKNELSISQYLGIIFLTITIIIIALLITIYIIEQQTSIKNYKITQENYDSIYSIVNNSNEITLQQKANFNKNYLLFGKKIIGYKVKDIIKEINI